MKTKNLILSAVALLSVFVASNVFSIEGIKIKLPQDFADRLGTTLDEVSAALHKKIQIYFKLYTDDRHSSVNIPTRYIIPYKGEKRYYHIYGENNQHAPCRVLNGAHLRVTLLSNVSRYGTRFSTYISKNAITDGKSYHNGFEKLSLWTKQ